MHEAMRKRILRRLETLPETQLYQVLDYIEFLESRYNRGIPEETTALQKLAEKLEDGLRKGKVNPSNLREAFQLISTADRVLSSVSAAGKQLLDELQAPEDGGAQGRDAHRTSAPSRAPSPGVPAPRPPGPSGTEHRIGKPPADEHEG
ncbi:hypothetical protein BH23GEM11_BH23GEM11_15250 [soil metagenome]